jgi:hypothetical protein
MEAAAFTGAEASMAAVVTGADLAGC